MIKENPVLVTLARVAAVPARDPLWRRASGGALRLPKQLLLEMFWSPKKMEATERLEPPELRKNVSDRQPFESAATLWWTFAFLSTSGFLAAVSKHNQLGPALKMGPSFKLTS